MKIHGGQREGERSHCMMVQLYAGKQLILKISIFSSVGLDIEKRECECAKRFWKSSTPGVTNLRTMEEGEGGG